MILPNIYGLGLAPARGTFNFDKGLVQESAFRIITDEYPIKVVLTREGELGQYLELEKEVMILENSETWIKYKLNMPETMPPGERAGGILVMQVPKDTLQENVVLAAPAIVHQVRVNVPYPGKYVVSKMYMTNMKLGEPVIFTIAAANYGKEKISKLKATIVIKGPTNEEVAVLHSDEYSINPGEEQKIITTWETENAGSYFAEATIEYDEKIMQLSERFDVGNLEIEIERIEVNNFKIGQIAKLDVYLRNKWNKPVKVEGKAEIFKDNSLVSTFNAIPVDILQGSSAVMNAYWNTEGIQPGEYDISVKATYEGKTSEKSFTSIVSLQDIKFNDFVSGKVIAKKGSQNTTLLIIAVFVLIIVNVLLFIYINKRLKSAPKT